MILIHYLTAQISKRVLFDPRYGVMRSEKQIIPPMHYDSIQATILLGVSVHKLSLSDTRYFNKTDQNVCLSQFLVDFWNTEFITISNNKITGKPDLLIIDHRAKEAIQPNFYKWLEDNSINYEFSKSNDQTAAAKFREHQKYPYISCKKEDFFNKTYRAENENHALSIKFLNERLISDRFNIVFTDKNNINTLKLYESRQSFPLINLLPINDDFKSNLLKTNITKNDEYLMDPSWEPASSISPKGFGSLLNQSDMSLLDDERTNKKAFFAALKALKPRWNLYFKEYQYSQSIEKLKKVAFKHTKCLDEVEYYSLCSTLGFFEPYEVSRLVFDVSKLKNSEIDALWFEYFYYSEHEISCCLEININTKLDYNIYFLQTTHNRIFFKSEKDSPADKFLMKTHFNAEQKIFIDFGNLFNADPEFFESLLMNDLDFILKFEEYILILLK